MLEADEALQIDFYSSLMLLTDPIWILQFVLSIGITFILTALISYHPSSLRKRDTLSKSELPKTMLTYGLVGMLVGFLVANYGTLIGFVVFGIGSLMRFRTEIDTSKDTGRVILIALIGLCVGLNLPHIAVFSTISAWILIYFLERENTYRITIGHADVEQIPELIGKYRELLLELGFELLSEKSSSSKQKIEFVVLAPRSITREEIRTLFDRDADGDMREHLDWVSV